VIISGALVVATGGGLSTWVAVTGSLPGSGGGESPVVVPAAVVTPGPTPTAVAAATAAATGQPTGATGKIVFRSNRDDPALYIGDIYTMDADGSNVRWVGAGGAPYEIAFSSGVSPDGSKAAFYKCPDQLGADLWAELVVTNPDGSGLVRLASGAFVCNSDVDEPGGFSWSPDSTRIVFRDRDPSGLYVADADGSNRQYLAEGFYPQWSPLGDSIVFVDKPDPEGWQCELYLINPDGTNRRLLARVPCEGGGVFCLLLGPRPQWSPDGSMLAFSASLDGVRCQPEGEPFPQRDILVVGADGAGLTNITNNSSDDYDPVWVDCRVPTAGCEAKVTNVQPDPLNARVSPGMDQEITGKLSEGDSVCLLGAPLVGDGYKWWPISTTDGTEGWVAEFDPQDPARLWITPTGEPCSGEAEPQEPARAGTGVGAAACGGRMRLGASIDDPEGDVPVAFVDIVGVRVEAMGEEVTAEIDLKDIPEQFTFYGTNEGPMEYAWQIFFDVDGDAGTGNAYRPWMVGADYSLSIISYVRGDSRRPRTGALRDNVQTNVAKWQWAADGCHWMTDWTEETATSKATAAVDDLGNVLTIRGTIPGIGPSTRWCAEAYYQDPDGRVTTDTAPD
jgi:hypothetical protein